MTQRFEPEDVDLAELAKTLRAACGPSVEGEVVGRTRLRDATVEHLGCSQLQAEELVDTLVARAFVVARRDVQGRIEWVIRDDDSTG